MLSHLINSFFIQCLFLEMLERRFPNELKNLATNVAFNILYFYSKLQIYFIKMQNNIADFVFSNPILSNIRNKLYAFMKPQEELFIRFVKNGYYLSEEEDKTKCDFSIVSWLGENGISNKMIMYDINKPIVKAENSNVKFILIEVIIKELVYKIEFKNNEYNFYLVGNEFTKQFFLYYLKELYFIYLDINDTDKLVVKILDHNCYKIELNDNDCLKLGKNDYEIYRLKDD